MCSQITDCTTLYISRNIVNCCVSTLGRMTEILPMFRSLNVVGYVTV